MRNDTDASSDIGMVCEDGCAMRVGGDNDASGEAYLVPRVVGEKVESRRILRVIGFGGVGCAIVARGGTGEAGARLTVADAKCDGARGPKVMERGYAGDAAIVEPLDGGGARGGSNGARARDPA